jgi:hypothetical protein
MNYDGAGDHSETPSPHLLIGFSADDSSGLVSGPSGPNDAPLVGRCPMDQTHKRGRVRAVAGSGVHVC